MLLAAVVAVSHGRDGGAGETLAPTLSIADQYLLAQSKASTPDVTEREAPICQRNGKTMTLGHRWLKKLLQ